MLYPIGCLYFSTASNSCNRKISNKNFTSTTQRYEKLTTYWQSFFCSHSSPSDRLRLDSSDPTILHGFFSYFPACATISPTGKRYICRWPVSLWNRSRESVFHNQYIKLGGCRRERLSTAAVFYTRFITFRTLFLFQGSDCTLHGLKIQHRPNLHYIIPSSFIKRYHSRQSPPKEKFTPMHFHRIRQNPCFVSRTCLSYPCNIIEQSTTELLWIST